jgi:hypothetical protein
MKKTILVILLAYGLLCLFSSLELVSANITTVNYTPAILIVVVLGVLVFFLALVGWLVIRRINEQRKKLQPGC